jgi:hypothetical protein
LRRVRLILGLAFNTTKTSGVFVKGCGSRFGYSRRVLDPLRLIGIAARDGIHSTGSAANRRNDGSVME